MAGELGYYVVHVPDAVRAKAFYRKVLGWNAEPGQDPKRYYHVDGSQPVGGINGGARTPHISTYYLVDDATAAVAKIRELGGEAPDASRSASGWSAECTDDQGGALDIWQPEPGYAPERPIKPGEGDLFYSVVQTADVARAKRFYGELFGWQLTEGSHPGGWNIHDTEPPAGLFGANEPGPSTVYFQVSDLEAALERVRAAGGTAGAVQPNTAGWHADCRDDQDTPFSLGSVRDA